MLVVPIGDEGRSPIVPWVNYTLIGLNVYAFFVVRSHPDLRAVIERFGLIPARPTAHAFITSLFLHADLAHLLGNMLYLYVVGHRIEETLGRVGFLLAYMTSGVFASAVHVVGTSNPYAACIGASGAIAGMLAIYMVLFPRTRIRFWYWFFIVFWGTFSLPAAVALGFWFVQQLLLLTLEEGLMRMTYVAYWAHVGGFVFGAVVAILIRTLRLLSLPGVKELLAVPRPRFQFHRDGRRLAAWEGAYRPARRPEAAELATEIEGDLARGAIDEALDAYRSTQMQSSPFALSPSAQIRVGNEFLTRGAVHDSCEAYERFLKAYPDSPWVMEVMFRLGYLYYDALRNGPAAMHYLRQVAAHSPDRRRAMQARAILDRVRIGLGRFTPR